jgi:hypothetical protein
VNPVLTGAVAGAVAAHPMTVLRMAARRAGWIERPVPQAVEESLVGGVAPDAPLAHHALDQVLHMGMGAALGALDGALWQATSLPTAARGVLIGGGSFLFATLVLLPEFAGGRSLGRSDAREIAVNLAAHLLFGMSTALVTEELAGQPDRGRHRSGRARRTG